MKLFYLTTPEKAREIQHPWHGLDVANGKVLICVRWKDEAHEMDWSNHPDVIRLPHPIFESKAALEPHHHQHLSGRFKLNPGDDVHHLIKQAAKEDPFMRLEVL